MTAVQSSPTSTGEQELRLAVTRRTDGAEGVVVLTLADPAGAELPAWSPGAHVDLVLTDDLTRQYSLCGDPSDPHTYRIGVLREEAGRGGSAHVHDHLHEGADVLVRGPRNHFELAPAERYVFVAGGIGITPILPMAAAARAAGTPYELHYGGRSRRSMAFLEELEGTLHPQDEVGLLDLDAILGDLAPGTLVYCCGPEPLLAAVEQRVAPEVLHVERFAPKDVGETVLAGAFEVELSLSGKTLTVPPDLSIMAVLRHNGVEVLSSCEEGTCGTCETGVLEGEVDHRDSLLTPAERCANDVMFVCVSRAACPKLVLEL